MTHIPRWGGGGQAHYHGNLGKQPGFSPSGVGVNCHNIQINVNPRPANMTRPHPHVSAISYINVEGGDLNNVVLTRSSIFDIIFGRAKAKR